MQTSVSNQGMQSLFGACPLDLARSTAYSSRVRSTRSYSESLDTESRRGDIGRRAFIGRRQAGWFCGTGCLRIRPEPKAINPRFLFDALGSPDSAGVIINRAKGSTMPNLNATVMRSVPILVASRRL